jgi:hypothetical protein
VESQHAIDLDGSVRHWGRPTSFAGPAVRDGALSVQLVAGSQADGTPLVDNPVVVSIGDVIHTPLTLPVAARLARHILALVETAQQR